MSKPKIAAARRAVREIENEWSRLQRKFESGVLVNFDDVYNRLQVAKKTLFDLEYNVWARSKESRAQLRKVQAKGKSK